MGCFQNGSHAKEVWVRIVGLPLHFWSREVFKRIRQSCGGFVAVDEETTLFSQLQWVHILVKTTRKDLPGSLQVLVGHTCFVVRLWWEAPPWVSQVVSWTESCRSAGREVRHDFVVGSHVGENVRESQPSVQKLRSEEQFKYGRRNRGVVGVAGRSAKGTVLDSDFLGLGSRTASCVEKKGKEVLGSSEWEQEKPTSGAGWAVGSNPSNPMDVGLAKGFMGPIRPKFKEAHPFFLFG